MNARSKAITVIPDPASRLPATIEEMTQHVTIVDEVKRNVMKDGVHYGVIPGCGKKPALLKPGAEKLCLAFKLSHDFEVEVEKFPNGHRQYTVTCFLRYRDGMLVGQGIGVCSTMESKYRFRSDIIGTVPPAYWDTRNRDLIGGESFTVKKMKNKWFVVQRVEHDNPADYYNTAAKIAKKRAHVDATLSATAASDIFEQDIDEREPGGDDADPENENQDAGGGAGVDSGPALSPDQVAALDKKITDSKAHRATFLRWLNAESLNHVAAKDYDRATKKLDELAKNNRAE